MAQNGISSHMNSLDLSDQDTEDLFASPSQKKEKTYKSNGPSSEAPQRQASFSRATSTPKESKYDADEAREMALRKELEGVRHMNEVIEGVVESLEKAKDNMDVRNYRSSTRALPSAFAGSRHLTNGTLLIGNAVCLPNRIQCFYPSSDLDSHPLPDRKVEEE